MAARDDESYRQAVEQGAAALIRAEQALLEFARLTYDNTSPDNPLDGMVDEVRVMDWSAAIEYRTAMRFHEETAEALAQYWFRRSRENPECPVILSRWLCRVTGLESRPQAANRESEEG